MTEKRIARESERTRIIRDKVRRRLIENIEWNKERQRRKKDHERT